MPIFKIRHITRYAYDRPVREGANQIKLYPREHAGQETLNHQLAITGEPSLHRFTDYWGNSVGQYMLTEPHVSMEIDSRLTVRVTPPTTAPLQVSQPGEWAELRAAVSGQLFLLDLAKPEKIEAIETAKQLIGDLRPNWDAPAMFIQRCAQHIFHHFEYQKGITTVETGVDEILRHQKGVCQDFAHVMLQLLRMTDIPARYVSGYICPNKNGMRGAGATHAWVEAWLPSTGWAGIDPTNNTWVSDQHVTLAVGRHFADCSPVKGTFKGAANQSLAVHVSVGYEDGHVFEENNAVEMRAERIAKLVAAAEIAQQ